MSITLFIRENFVNYKSKNSYAFKMRSKRARRIMNLIDACFQKYGEVNLVDVGGTETYWDIFPKEYLSDRKVHITLINTPETTSTFKPHDLFTIIEGDGCDLHNFSDKKFHIAHSNSVIEHVGISWERKVAFANEMVRVAENYYIQTPNYWFPLEPHFVTPFFQWLPKSIRIKLLQNFTLGWFKKTPNYEKAKAIVEGCDLLSAKEMIKLFPAAELHREKLLFLTKSLIMINR